MVELIYERPTMIELGSFGDLTLGRRRRDDDDHDRRHRRRHHRRHHHPHHRW
jgi:hypothetical protein